MTVADDKIVVKSGDDIIVWVGNLSSFTIQSDNTELALEVRKHLTSSTAVPILAGRPHILFMARTDTHIGFIAAMFAPNPGQSAIITAPPRALAELKGYHDEGSGYFMLSS